MKSRPTRIVPESEYLIALLTRLSRICRRRTGSVRMRHRPQSTAASTTRPFSEAAGASSHDVRDEARDVDGRQLTRSIPASMRSMSSRSLTMSSRCLPLSCTISRFLAWRAGMSASVLRSTMRLKPMIAFSGVRSSWDMLARNCDLSRPASTSAAFVDSSSAFVRSSLVFARSSSVLAVSSFARASPISAFDFSSSATTCSSASCRRPASDANRPRKSGAESMTQSSGELCWARASCAQPTPPSSKAAWMNVERTGNATPKSAP